MFAIGLLGWLLMRDPHVVLDVLPQLLAWGLVIAAATVSRFVSGVPATLTMSLPVTLAVGMLFDPVSAAVVTLVASLDPREIKGDVSVARALVQQEPDCLGCACGVRGVPRSWGARWEWPGMLLPALAALDVDFLVNTGLVVGAAGLSVGARPDSVLRRILNDSPAQYFLGYLVLGLLAILLATVGLSAGAWGAVAFLAPLALARLDLRAGRATC